MAIQERNSEMVNLLSVDFISKTDTAYLLGIVTGAILALPGLIAFWPMQVSVSDSDDIYPDYAYLPGRVGGQHLHGGTESSDDLTLESTADATKGDVILQPNGGKVSVQGYMSIGTATIPTYGSLSVGDEAADYSPTISDWNTTETTLLLNALNHAVIGFNDAGARVDFIRVGAGVITIGYDGGFGKAYTYLPGGALVDRGSNANGSLAIAGTSLISYFNFDTAEHTYLRGGKSTANVYVGDTNDGIIVLGSGNGQVLPQGKLGTAWTGLSFTAGWGDFGGIYQTGQYKIVGEMVFLRGLVVRSSGVSTTIATLPTGYWPPAEVIFVVTSNTAFGEVRIDTSGNIVLIAGAATTWVSLTGIVFSTAT